MERVGIATAHICSIVPVALMVGSNRVVTGNKIVNPVGTVDLPSEDEIGYRRAIVMRALHALQVDVKKPTVFETIN